MSLHHYIFPVFFAYGFYYHAARIHNKPFIKDLFYLLFVFRSRRYVFKHEIKWYDLHAVYFLLLMGQKSGPVQRL
ncbi:hypothetical protein SDC9_170136 [bioreactor metagenome]|uniref:Uncharacterized protein n=1 Tax=bioreactor metagenome TaxID=1076179 RepID=A0A645GG84_9ZZZZ